MLTQICAKRIIKFPVILALILFSAFPVTLAAEALKHISLTRTGLMPEDIAIIINDSDPLSRQVGSYYQRARQIPEVNVIHLRFPPDRTTLTATEFKQLKAKIDRLTPEHVQAFAVAWTAPYRVDCMSLTSALAFGFDKKYCADKCEPTAPSPYFNALGSYPLDDYKMRPAMMLAGTSFTQVKDLIDRGIASDHTFPKGQAYLLNTSDKARRIFRHFPSASIGSRFHLGSQGCALLFYRTYPCILVGHARVYPRCTGGSPDIGGRHAYRFLPDEQLALAGSRRHGKLWHGH